jgi:hypothetical protein
LTITPDGVLLDGELANPRYLARRCGLRLTPEPSAASQSSRFRQVFDQGMSYELVNPNETPWLSLDVVAAGQRTPFATSARLPVPMLMYGLRSVLLCERSGHDIARVNYDVRRIEARPNVETPSDRRWDEADRLAHAVSFGRAMVGPMAVALARRTEVLAARPTSFVNVSPSDQEHPRA